MKQFSLSIDTLRDGSTQEIHEKQSPDFLHLPEGDEIHFKKEIQIDGEAYIAEDFLIVKLDIHAQVELPCAICNDEFSLPIHIPELIHEEPIKQIKHGVFDYSEIVREAILLEVPFYPQCGSNQCKNRKNVEKYLSKNGHKKDEEHQPFKDLF